MFGKKEKKRTQQFDTQAKKKKRTSKKGVATKKVQVGGAAN